MKPFSFEELTARLRAMTRGRFGMASNVITVADLSLDTAAHTVKQGDREITLSAKEYALLEYLMRNAGTVLSRERIEDHIWNADYEGGTNVVDVYISYLRKKIDGGHENKLIHTVRGSGMFCGRAHEACVDPIEDHPLVCRDPHVHGRPDLCRDLFRGRLSHAKGDPGQFNQHHRK